jgi:hypothetical protein
MQNWLKELKPTIERLQQQYNKSCIKIIADREALAELLS